MIKSYRDLQVWEKSYQLTKDIYDLCQKLPSSEQYGLISQIQRSAVSIPSNVAEGQQRQGSKEFKRFLGISRGSAAELSTQLMLLEDIYGISTKELVLRTEAIQKMLYSLQNKL